MDVGCLIPFAAGNFLYIGASDPVPDVNRHKDQKAYAVHLMAFVIGAVPLFFARIMIDN